MDKKLVALNLILLAFLLAMIVFSKLLFKPIMKPAGPQGGATAGFLPRGSEEVVIHDMGAGSKKEYDSIPSGEAGGAHGKTAAPEAAHDMPGEWAMLPQDEKEEFLKGLDAGMERAKDALAVNPQDRNARALLVISENLKSLASKNFKIQIKKAARE